SKVEAKKPSVSTTPPGPITSPCVCLVITPPLQPTEEWEEFYQQTLLKFAHSLKKNKKNEFWPEVELEGRKCLLTAKRAELIPELDSRKKKTELVVFSEIVTPFTMRKRRIADFLGQGLDVAVYSGHGMEEIGGVASEESSYEDISTLAGFLFQKEDRGGKGYDPKTTCLFATCGSCFNGIYLLKKYQEQGLNCLLEAPPDSLDAAIRSYPLIPKTIVALVRNIFNFLGFFFALVFKCLTLSAFILPSFSIGWLSTEEILHLADPCLKKKYQADLDGWNNLKKVNELKEKTKKCGYAVIIGIKGDALSCPEEVKKMAGIFAGKMREAVYLFFQPKVASGAHFQNGWEAPELQEEILKTVHGTV
ncbi:MAG: hypothetical protein WC371_00030, partial [Parachlamydiales bacterium]